MEQQSTNQKYEKATDELRQVIGSVDMIAQHEVVLKVQRKWIVYDDPYPFTYGSIVEVMTGRTLSTHEEWRDLPIVSVEEAR